MVDRASRGNLAPAGSGAPAAVLMQLHDLLHDRRVGEARSLLRRLGDVARHDPRLLACAAYADALAGRLGPALDAAAAALRSPSLDPASLNLVGSALTHAHRPALAHEAFGRAARLAPADPGALFNLATTARFLGREAEAEALLDQVLARAPRTWPAYRNRSELRAWTAADNHIELMMRALNTLQPPWEGEVQICYALGKEYEDLGRYEDAFRAFSRGARMRRARMRYAVEDDIEALLLIEQHFDADYCAPARTRTQGAGPIFVLGLPRTGSTLVERLLGAYPDIQPLGELQAFGSALVAETRKAAAQPPTSKAGLIGASARVSPEAIGKAYLESVAPLRDGSPFFIDKLPINYLYAGTIARALPTARVIHVRRHPADVCLAMFKTLFDEAYPFSYALEDLGRYHNAYRRLMAHWRSALGSRLIEVSYEAVVADPAGVLGGVLAELGVVASAAASDSAAPVMTASASQVRAPIHQRSVASARRYRAQLAPLFGLLDEADTAA